MSILINADRSLVASVLELQIKYRLPKYLICIRIQGCQRQQVKTELEIDMLHLRMVDRKESRMCTNQFEPENFVLHQE